MAQHVDADGRVVVDFDHHSPEIAPDPYPAYGELREKCPVAWSNEHGGFWVLSDYASVYAASRDDKTFCSAPSVALPPVPYGIRNIPIDTDNPETEQLRKVLLREYTPGAVARLEPEMVALADELIDGFAAAGSCDLVTELAMPLPARLILRLIGIDETDWEWYVQRIHTIVHGMTGEAAVTAGFEMAVRVGEIMQHRRTTADYRGHLGLLMSAKIDGEPLSDADVLSYMLLLLFGGLDTTTASTANALLLLDHNRELRVDLIAHPEKLPRAVEEFLRHDAPVQALGRTLSRDVEFGGQQLRAGERALLVWASANRDRTEFDDPDILDFDRTPNRHLSFGVGLHRCLGSNLGRAMFRIMLERVLARIPDYRVVGDATQYRYTDAAIVYALHHLPVKFTPAPR
jgi:cytochrome P450